MVTAVMVELLEPPPPQAIIPRRADKAKIRARVRKPFPQDAYERSIHTANEYLNEKYLRMNTGQVALFRVAGGNGPATY